MIYCSYPGLCTDKKENQIFFIYKEIQNKRLQSHIWLTASILIYDEIFAHFLVNYEALPHMWRCNCSTLNFHILYIYEENFILFFISVGGGTVLWKNCISKFRFLNSQISVCQTVPSTLTIECFHNEDDLDLPPSPPQASFPDLVPYAQGQAPPPPY